jgi:hypothetical protein
LNLDWGLGDIGVVVEDVVVTDHVDDAVEDVGVNAYSSSVLIMITVAPVFKEVDLRRFLDGRILAEDP